jgi:23S rRNA (uracil1939-C5)-methyltransferase
VQFINGKPALGFYKKGSHTLIPIDQCLIQHPLANKLISPIKEILTKFHIPPYNEKNHTGVLRHALIRVSAAKNNALVCFVINSERLPKAALIAKELSAIEGVAGIFTNINMQKGNVILGERAYKLWGADTVRETVGHVKFNISPASFFQVNPQMAKTLYDSVVKLGDFTKEDSVLDLYCGAGAITLYIARLVKKVFGIEEVIPAIEDARRNAKFNNINNVQFHPGKAETILPALAKARRVKADIVVLDPPRTGCEETVLRETTRLAPRRIVYVSCDPVSLARDMNILKTLGYSATVIQPVDMFPHTTHIECVAGLEKI